MQRRLPPAGRACRGWRPLLRTCTWNKILMRSRGAVAVLATAPASAPAAICSTISVELEGRAAGAAPLLLAATARAGAAGAVEGCAMAGKE